MSKRIRNKMSRSIMQSLLIASLLMFPSTSSMIVGMVKAIEFSAFYIYDVPYVSQADTYWCGPASLTMTLNYWFANVTQEKVAAEIYDPTLNLTIVSKMKAYPQKIGFKAEELTASIDDLRRWISKGYPLIVLQKFSLQNTYGHYRVVVGYSDERELLITFDPILGNNHNVTYTEFSELWKPGLTFSTFNWTLKVTPENSFLTSMVERYQFLKNQSVPLNNKQPIRLEDIYLIVSALALALGAVGGIPQIMRWLRPKPRLKITKANIEGSPESRIRIDIEVKNEEKWWGRNRDATFVTAEWYMIDKDHEQWGAVFNQTLSPYLSAGTKVSRQHSSAHSFIVRIRSNPKEIHIR